MLCVRFPIPPMAARAPRHWSQQNGSADARCPVLSAALGHVHFTVADFLMVWLCYVAHCLPHSLPAPPPAQIPIQKRPFLHQ